MSDRDDKRYFSDEVLTHANVTVYCTRCHTDTVYPPGVLPTDVCPHCRDRDLELARQVVEVAREVRTASLQIMTAVAGFDGSGWWDAHERLYAALREHDRKRDHE